MLLKDLTGPWRTAKITGLFEPQQRAHALQLAAGNFNGVCALQCQVEGLFFCSEALGA